LKPKYQSGKRKEASLDTISRALTQLVNTDPLCNWPDGVRIIQEIGTHPSSHWYIPEATCLSVGGSSQDALPAVAALIALHTSIVMVDDLIDEDGRFEAQGWKQGDLANLAQGITAAGFTVLLQSSVDEITKMTAITYFNQMMAQTSMGQHLDAHAVIQDEAAYWRLVRAKSSPFFGAAFAIGAVLGRARKDMISALNKVGSLYGEMVQIHDDLKDALTVPASADWLSGHSSLPILFARSVSHPQRDLFLRLQQDLSVSGALQEAQKILVRCGAVSYCIKQLLERGEMARELLSAIPLVNPGPLNVILDQVVQPAKKILENLANVFPA
jgi:geranylgeranyl pyrophosphate synthase